MSGDRWKDPGGPHYVLYIPSTVAIATRQDRANFPAHPKVVPSKLNFCRIVSKRGDTTPHTNREGQ